MLGSWIGFIRLALLSSSDSTTELPEEIKQACGSLLSRTPEELLALMKRALEVREGLRENTNIRLSLESLLLAF